MIRLSLTGLSRLLALLAVVGVIILFGREIAGEMAPILRRSDAQLGESGQISRRLIVYRLDSVRPTVFRFTQPVRQTRLVIQPIIAAGAAQPGEGWRYAIRLELLDSAGQVVSTQLIYSRTTLYAIDGHRRGPFRFYRGQGELVAPPDETRIASAVPFAAVRLLAGAGDPDVIAMDARVSERRPLIASVAASAFLRFSSDDRARLAGPNAFPPELLTQDERTNIAINQWRPVGPTGIDGRDYVTKVLHEETGSPLDSDDPAADEGEVGG